MKNIEVIIGDNKPIGRFRGAAKWEIQMFILPTGPEYFVVSYDRLMRIYENPASFSSVQEAFHCASVRMNDTVNIPLQILEKPTFGTFLRTKSMDLDRTERRLWKHFYSQPFTTEDTIIYFQTFCKMDRYRALYKAVGFLEKMMDAGYIERVESRDADDHCPSFAYVTNTPNK